MKLVRLSYFLVPAIIMFGLLIYVVVPVIDMLVGLLHLPNLASMFIFPLIYLAALRYASGRGFWFKLHAVPDRFGTEPIQAWKVAYVEVDLPFYGEYRPGVPKLQFKPYVSGVRYGAGETAAECRSSTSSDGPVPHDLGDNHACGFYAYNRLAKLRRLLFLKTRCGVLLHVELFGEVIEGSRSIYRAQYQRVLRVFFFDLCEECPVLHPRPAVELKERDNGVITSVCQVHRACHEAKRFTIEDVAQLLQTEVRYRRTWLSRPLRLLHRL